MSRPSSYNNNYLPPIVATENDTGVKNDFKPKVNGLKRTYAEVPVKKRRTEKEKATDHFRSTVIDRLDRIETVLNEMLASIVPDSDEDIPVTQCLD